MIRASFFPTDACQRDEMMYTRVKICGVTTPQDALLVADAGADAIGLNFYADSPRVVSVDTASEIVRTVAPFVTVVGLFVDEPAERVARIAERAGIEVLQFHGDESPAFCAQFGRPWLKALRMRPGLDVQAEVARYAAARGVLLDNWREGVPGGTGERFDWSLAPRVTDRPWVLAGGLNPDNVGEAVVQLKPAAVDVSGGVEASPGKKCSEKVRSFVAAVRAADERSGG